MKTLLIVLIIFLLFALVFMIYSGILKKVSITEKNIGPLKLVYLEHTGDYSQAGTISNKVYSILKEKYKIDTKKGFGIYFDNPREVKKEDLKSEIGCIIELKDYPEIERVSEDFMIKDYPEQKVMYTEFPFKNNLSILLGIIKVYPKMIEYIQNKGYKPSPAIEIYDIPNKKTIYAFPIINETSIEEKTKE